MTGQGPLTGLRIVEIDAIGPLPLAGMMLADLGAEVIRIVRPASAASAWDDVGGAVLHRSRKAITLDLKAQPQEALALIAKADALIEGMRPGVMERLGLGPDDCLRANPRLVYGRITGWGQTGPLAPTAGHDINFVGLTGVLRAIGPADQPPPVPLNMIGDYGAGTMLLVTGVLAALLSARATGRGQVVDAAIVDGVALQSSLFRAFLASGGWAPDRAANLLDGAAPHYRCYRCADDRFLAVGALEPPFYRQFVEGIGLSPDDFPQHDQTRWPHHAAVFAASISERSRDEWAAIFAGSDACVTPVLDWDEAATHPHAAARSAFRSEGGALHPAPAPRFSATPGVAGPADGDRLEAILERWGTKAAQ